MGDQQVPVVDTEANQGGYALSGKIMLSAIIILFAVVVFMVGLHLYARWYLLRLRRRQLERRRQRRGGRTHHVVLHSEQQHPVAGADRGLEPAVLNSLPVFLHATKPDGPVQECAVCLSEFEEKDIVRLLPKCNHSFHIECIDMWFHSHSTCPLCRSAVEPVVKPVEPECTACSECGGGSGAGEECATSSGGVGGRKGFEVRIEIPARRPADMVNELTQSSPAGRILSRIISMGRRSPRVSSTTPSGAGPSCGPSGLDLESGSGRVATPR